MYNSVFLNSFGSNIFDTLGSLEALKDKLRKTVIWNSCGSSSIIIYFKILGFSYPQTLTYIKNFDLIHTFINGFSIIPEDSDDKKNIIESWLIEGMEVNNLFKKESTIEEVFKVTNIFLNFIVWSRKQKKLISINPSTYPKMKLLDAVLSTLTQLNCFSEILIKEEIFSSYISGSFFPVKNQFLLENKKINTLYITNYSNFLKNVGEQISLIGEVEEEIITQFLESHNSYIENTQLENFIILYSDIFKVDFSDKIKDSCYNNGKEQGKNFLQGLDNLSYYEERKSDIKNQN